MSTDAYGFPSYKRKAREPNQFRSEVSSRTYLGALHSSAAVLRVMGHQSVFITAPVPIVQSIG